MGSVYVAVDNRLGRRVAIKFLTAASEQHYRARFLREARAVSLLSHPNITTVFDYGETPKPYIVMELVRGRPLNELLAESKINLVRAVEIGAAVADALSEAHAHGIIHRDIKPANVIVTERGQVKVLDFGLAKQLYEEQFYGTDKDAKTLLATRTRSEVVVGTPLYLSPEQATGGKVDGRSDLFALGAMLYECATGRSAFTGSSVIEIGAQVLHVDPPKPSSINGRIPAELDRIIIKSLAKKPGDRYQSAADLIADLNAVKAIIPETDQGTARIGPHQTQPSALRSTFNEAFRRPRVSLGVFVVGIAVVGLLLGVGLRYWHRSPYKPSAAAAKWYEQGVTALHEGAFYQASKAFDEAIKSDPGFALAHARLAESWVELDYSDRARAELLRATQLVTDRATLSDRDALYFDAISAVATPDFPRAIDFYKKIVAQDPSPAAYLDLARAYERNDQVAEAIHACLLATNRDATYGTAFLRLGILYQRSHDMKSAGAAYDKADTLFQAQGNMEGRTELLLRKGSQMRELGKFVEAKNFLRQSFDLAGANNSELPRINALIEMGRVAYAEGATPQAEEYAKQAIDFAEQHGLETPMVRSLISLGNAFLAKGDYDQADKNFALALGVAQRNKSPYLENLSLANIGVLRYYQLRTDESLDLSQKALAFFESGGYRSQAMFATITLSRATRRRGDFDRTLETLERRLKLANEGDDPRQTAVTHSEIAMALLEREQFVEALDQYTKACTEFQELGDRFNLAFAWMNRASVLWRLGRYADSTEALRQAGDLANRPEGRYEQVLLEIGLISGLAELSQRNFAEARIKSQQVMGDGKLAYEELPIEAKAALGLTQAFLGSTAEGERLCSEAVDAAGKVGDVTLLTKSELALAQAQLANKNARGALATATRVQRRVALTGQLESEWRAWAIEGLASRALHDESSAQQQFTQSGTLLSRWKQSLGTEGFDLYVARPDIHAMLQESGIASPAETTTPTTH